MTDYADLEKRLREFADETEEHAHSAIDHPYDGTDQSYHDACMDQATLARSSADAIASLTSKLKAREGHVLVPVQMTKPMALQFARYWHDNYSEDHVFEHTPAQEMWRDVLSAVEAFLSRDRSDPTETGRSE